MNKIYLKYKELVEKIEGYEFIRVYKKGDILPSGKVVGNHKYIQIKHKYCERVYEVDADGFINQGVRCGKCCGSYEKSFAYHIEQELSLDINDVWDFEKNTVNPYHISKNYNGKVWIKCQNEEINKSNGLMKKEYHPSYEVASCKFVVGQRCPYCVSKKIHVCDSFAQYHIDNTDKDFLYKYWDWGKNNELSINPWEIGIRSNKKVWIKCQEKDYHGSYQTSCSNFTTGRICSYCSKQRVIHPKDSFAQYHIENTDPNFLDKYWDWEKNKVSPWEITPKTQTKIWIKCQSEEVNELNGMAKKDYHGSYEIYSGSFTNGGRCSYCGNHKTHHFDSFGYHNFDKTQSWDIVDNKISPFRVAKSAGKKYGFICHICGHRWESSIGNISSGCWCPKCSISKGEKKIKSWLDKNNVTYAHDEEYFENLVGLGGGILRPDFILEEEKIWIEYDGEFHYKNYFRDGKYEKLKYHDRIKDEYAKKHNWKLIRIPYWEFDSIEEILDIKIKITTEEEIK